MQKKTVILHIGWEKTGTSSLQTFLASNADWMEANDLHYPALGSVPQHRWLYRRMARNHPRQLEHAIATVQNIIRDRHESTIILSHESLHLIPPHLFSELCAGADVRVIAYIRRYDSAVLSYAGTMVRWGMLNAPRSANLPLKLRGFLGRFDYYWTLLGFARVFGFDSVTVRIYDPDRMSGGSIIPDFMTYLGHKDLSAARYPDRRANISLSAAQLGAAIAVGRELDGERPFAGKRMVDLCHALLALGKDDVGPSIEEATPLALRRLILNFYRSSTERLSETFFQGADVFKPLDETSTAPRPGAEEVVDWLKRLRSGRQLDKSFTEPLDRALARIQFDPKNTSKTGPLRPVA